jgi:hypothetical protein
LLNLNHLDRAIKEKYQKDQELYFKLEQKMGVKPKRPISAALPKYSIK